MKRKGKVTKENKKSKSARPSQNVVNRSQMSKLSCCKCLFDHIKATLAEIQPENRQNVQNDAFWQKAQGVNACPHQCNAQALETGEIGPGRFLKRGSGDTCT